MKMKKNDWILIALIVCVSVSCMWLYTKFGEKKPAQVVVSIDGEKKETYNLTEDAEIKINGTNEFVIRDGEVKMKKADCPDQICVHHRAISKNKESIVCLPNKVILEVISDEEPETDAAAN